jgi:abortive infection bacteriophage resistance protein
MPVPYTKAWLSISGQIQKLKSYGLIIPDDLSATFFLQHINYYRFSGYALAFETSRHVYQPGTTFDQIRHAYEFDRALRDLVTESLEVIELDLRTAIAHAFGRDHGAFGHTDSSKFFKKFGHGEWLDKLHEEVNRSSELFVRHFKTTYQEFPDLPIWEATEIMSFGALSRMYNGMLVEDQKRIASRYGLQPAILGSWLHHLVYLRNLCAHHSRIWDRDWAIKPLLPAGKVWLPPLLPSNAHVLSTLLIQSAILRRCPAERCFTSGWRSRIESLIFNNLPSVPDAATRMDLIADWQKHPVWA